jgi:hypothetical protein
VRKANDVFEIVRGLPASRVPTLLLRRILWSKVIIKIAHEYRQLPGNHNWQYWDQQVREVLGIAAEKMPGLRSAN